MTIFQLAAELTLNTKNFLTGIKDAASKFKWLADDVVKMGKTIQTFAKPMDVAIAGAAKLEVALTKALGEGVTKLAGATLTAVTKLGEGLIAVGGQAVDAFSTYEQQWGGVQTLFKDSADTVLANAQAAYRTAGVSANQYMEQVTGFAASLLQSTGNDTAKAAAYADMAMRDMSDNANKMGTSIGSLQYAYQGFAKQNYTMLDNLNNMGALVA